MVLLVRIFLEFSYVLDLSLIAIGAYCPRDFMKPQHINPEEAVQIHEDLKSKKSLGIHWGTFILTDEPEDEPPKLLREEAAKKNLGENDFVVTRIGETRIVGKETSHCKEGELEVLHVK
jgi:N-acyl-phosphatidylethanolamine-hydrolysing phospholipase D